MDSVVTVEEAGAFLVALALLAWWFFNRAGGKAGEASAPASADVAADNGRFIPRFSG